MKVISDIELQNLRYAVQHFQDCYLVSTIGALTNTSNGRKILTENIVHTQEGFRIRFNNVNGKTEDYFVTQKEMDNLVYLDDYMNAVKIKIPHNPLIKALEVAMNKLLKRHPFKKPLVCRIPNCHERFEFNKPSNFLEMFTGKKAIILNESNFNISLKSRHDEAIELFKAIGRHAPNSFIGGTTMGFKKGMSNNHCYTIIFADNHNKQLHLFDHRLLEIFSLSYEEAVRKLKFIAGYFNSDLK